MRDLNIPANTLTQFKRRIAFLFLIVLAVHLSMCLYLTAGPKQTNRNDFLTYYKRYLLPGPFFNEEHIKISPHTFVSYKNTQGSWSVFTDYGIYNFSTFLHSPWRYDKLKESDYLRHAVRLVYLKIGERNFESLKNDKEFIELNAYLLGELLPPDKVDSIRLLYVFQKFSTETGTVSRDTVLSLQYKPSDIVPIQ